MPGDPDTLVEINNFYSSLQRKKNNNDKKASVCNMFIPLPHHTLISNAAIHDVTTEITVTRLQTRMLPTQLLTCPQAMVSGCLQTQVNATDSFS